MSLGASQGGLPPDAVVDSAESILRDSQRVIEHYHDPRPGAMVQIVLAPCSPFSVTPDLMKQSALLARHYGVHLHTVVYLYPAGNSVACITGIIPPFHYHGRGQRDGIPPLFLPVGAVGSALAVLHVAYCLAQQSRRGHPEATRAHATIPQAPSGPEALSWPHPQAPLRGLCAGNCAAPPSALRPPTPYRLHAWPPAPGGHVGALLPLPRL